MLRLTVFPSLQNITCRLCLCFFWPRDASDTVSQSAVVCESVSLFFDSDSVCPPVCRVSCCLCACLTLLWGSESLPSPPIYRVSVCQLPVSLFFDSDPVSVPQSAESTAVCVQVSLSFDFDSDSETLTLSIPQSAESAAVCVPVSLSSDGSDFVPALSPSLQSQCVPTASLTLLWLWLCLSDSLQSQLLSVCQSRSSREAEREARERERAILLERSAHLQLQIDRRRAHVQERQTHPGSDRHGRVSGNLYTAGRKVSLVEKNVWVTENELNPYVNRISNAVLWIIIWNVMWAEVRAICS